MLFNLKHVPRYLPVYKLREDVSKARLEEEEFLSSDFF